MPRARVRVQTPVGSKSRTIESQSDETDINRIVNRFMKSGTIDHLNSRQATYGDNSAAMDLKASLDAVMIAEDSFGALDAHIRAAANNDPATLLNMLSTEEGVTALQEAGMDLYDTDGVLIPVPTPTAPEAPPAPPEPNPPAPPAPPTPPITGGS